MNSNKHQPRLGFSAVEVMIALIIAGLFLFAGYQLFAIVHQSQLYARSRSEAANIAYAYLRKASNADFVCPQPGHTLDTAYWPSEYNLKNLSVITKRSCPYGNLDKILKIEVEVQYDINGSHQFERQAIYVDKT